MKDIWNLQFRLPSRAGKKAEAVMGHKRFRAAYDFLLLREASGENLSGLGQWWTEYQEADETTREQLRQRSDDKKKRKRKRKRRPNQDRMKPDSHSP